MPLVVLDFVVWVFEVVWFCFSGASVIVAYLMVWGGLCDIAFRSLCGVWFGVCVGCAFGLWWFAVVW